MFDFRNLNPSMEMIDAQYGDPIVDKLKTLYGKLVEYAELDPRKLRNAGAYHKLGRTKNVIAELDKVISERFGMTFKHVAAENIGYGIFTVPPATFNVLAGNVGERLDMYRKMLGKGPCNPEYETCKTKESTNENTKQTSELNNYHEDYESVIYRVYNSHLELEKAMNGKGIKIDRAKANIKGLPKDYNLIVVADLYMMITTFKLTAEELTAVILHEIGHAYTHLENSYRTVRNTTALVDTIRKNVAKGKSTNDVLNIVYKDVLGGKEDLKGSSTTTAVYKTLNLYMDWTSALNENDTHSYTDSEQLADQFAARFGVGAALGTGLEKLHNYRPPAYMLSSLISYSIIIGLFAIAVIAALPIVILLMFLLFIVDMLTGGRDANATTYDKTKMRYQRVRNDMVRVLRNTDVDKKTLKALLGEIKVLDDVIERAEDDTGLYEKLKDVLTSRNRAISNTQALEELLESLMENNLHVAAAKLRAI